MTVLKRFLPSSFAGLSVALLVFLWLAFAPRQAGGLASYVIIVGNSMEPKFRMGDLVIVHAEAEYQIGDAVVYRNIELGSFVFHRIISTTAGRYILQGDNNPWVDTYRPSPGDVLGKSWLHVPGGGRIVQKVRSPWIMALAAASLGGVLAVSVLRKKTKGKPAMSKATVTGTFSAIKQKVNGWLVPVKEPQFPRFSRFPEGDKLEVLFFVLAFILVASIVMGALSFSRPAYRTVQDDLPYQHMGMFSYQGAAPFGVYDSNSITSGDPIFPHLTCSVDLRFQYTLIGQRAENVQGTYQLVAVIGDATSGWQRRIPLQEKTAFTDSAFNTMTTLDLCKFSSLTTSMEERTGFQPGSYRVHVMPDVQVTGNISGRDLEATFNPVLTFLYNRTYFSVVRNDNAENPLGFIETAALTQERSEVNTVRLPGAVVAVSLLRWLAALGVGGSLAGLILLAFCLQALARSKPAHFARVKYDSLIVDVETVDTIPASSRVQVTSMDALAKVAERLNGMILHEDLGHSHSYHVHGCGVTYQFTAQADTTGSTVPGQDASP